MSHRQQLSGYVLHKRAYRETSMLIDFFTLELGRIGAVARGARGNSKSDRKSLLQPLQKNEFEVSGRSSLKSLGRIESLAPSIRLSNNALYCSFYMNELLSRALPEAEPIVELYSQYEQSLLLMAGANQDDLFALEPILREFEFAMLLALGYLPDFDYDADNGEAIEAQHSYSFDAMSGFTRCHPQVKKAIMGELLIAIANGEYKDSQNMSLRQAAKYICRQAMAEIIGDKPIKSRELFISRWLLG